MRPREIRTRLTALLGMRYPIVQAGMSWASSHPSLPIAVSKSGGLGVVAAGPLSLDEFRTTVRAVRSALDAEPFAINVPLTRADADDLLATAIDEHVPVVIASQGGVRGRAERVRAAGAKWLHVVASIDHARKAAAAGVDGVVVVGAEAGGHPPPNEVGTLVVVRRVAQELALPVVAGGGVADGFGIAALLALGADAVQLGTRFLLTHEGNVHPRYKEALLAVDVDGTTLVGRRARPIRGLRNRFAAAVETAERSAMPDADYEALLKSSSLKLAALDGDVEWGKVEAGQSAGLITELLSTAEVMRRLVDEIELARRRLEAM